MRTSKETNPHSFWPTPHHAVLPLLPHLDDKTWFDEPCAGAGDLIAALEAYGHYCCYAADIEPRGPDNGIIEKCDALKWRNIKDDNSPYLGDAIITNPPFSRHNHPTLFEMIRIFAAAKPTWLLLPSTFKNNDYAPEFMAYCHKVQVIGRIKWVPDSAFNSTMDFDWYLFDKNAPFEGTKFYPKMPPLMLCDIQSDGTLKITKAQVLDRAGAA